MVRSWLHGDAWVIPAIRMKGKLKHVVSLSPAAGAIIEAVPNLGEFVFTLNGRHATRNFADDMRKLDEAGGGTGWHLHDLCGTARSLVSRAGVNSDIAGRCLAPARSAAFRASMMGAPATAAQLERIVHAFSDNVVPLQRVQ